MSRMRTQEEYLELARKTHGNRYDYSRVVYSGAFKPIEILCSIHGSFFQGARDHIRGAGCPICANNVKLVREDVINRFHSIHQNKYDYSKVVYKSSKDLVDIICPKHGVFRQTPRSHLIGRGCPKCGKLAMANKVSGDNNWFIKKAINVHGDTYDYSNIDYHSAQTKVSVICKKHGEFFIRPSDHFNGVGCPKCVHKISQNESDLFLHLQYLGFNVISQYRIGRKEIDLFIPELSLGFEHNGFYYHHAGRKDIEYHEMKSDFFLNAGIRLFHLWDWCDLDLLKSVIESKVGKTNRLFTITGVIHKISVESAHDFYFANSVFMGYLSSEYNYGLFFGDILYSVMSFDCIEENRAKLSQYASLRHYQIIGGMQCLLNYFERNEPWAEVIECFANRDLTPNPYQSSLLALGFNFSNACHSDLVYYNLKERKLYSHETFLNNKRLLLKEYDLQKSENDNCLENKIFPVYTSGFWKFIKMRSRNG